MSKYFADEAITVSGSTVGQLTLATFTVTGGARATKAYITHVDGDDPVLYRFAGDPTKVPILGHPLTSGGGVVVEGYDNLVAVRFLLNGTDPARLVVSYAA